MRRPGLLASMTLALGALTACSKTPEPPPFEPPPRPAAASATPTQSPHAAAPRSQPAPDGPKDVGWDAPASWQKADNPNPMRKATYKIPKVAGDPEDAELAVSSAGGSVDQNVQRWVAQFQGKAPEVKRTEKKVGDLAITEVEIRGTFSGSGMPGAATTGPKEKWEMLAAMVETTPPTFFKITGPEKTVAAAKTDFDKLLDGMRAK